jgi:ubiquinone/menaquinone biosynthesis C-methylase UbiE
MDVEDYLKVRKASTKNARAKEYLDARYSTNKYGWPKWFFDQIFFPPHATVLELGCGPASLWANNIGRVPEDACILLTDFRKEALDEAKKLLGARSDRFGFGVVNAEEIPYGDNLFDIVIANRMLYFLSERKKALAEISRVLKPNGVMYASTVGKNNMAELINLFFDCFSVEDRERKTVADAFGLENGKEQLMEFFRSVDVRRYENELVVTGSGPLIEYVFSSRSINKKYLTPQRMRVFKNYLDGILRRKGSIRVTKDMGLLVAEK